MTVSYTYGGRTVSAQFEITVYDNIAGDANGDGDVNIKDVLACRKAIAGLDPGALFLMTNADADADRELTLKDVLKIRRISAGLE